VASQKKSKKKLIALVVVVIVALCVWFFTRMLPDVFSDMGKDAYKRGHYEDARLTLMMAILLNHGHRDARYYYVQTLLKLKPTFDVQRDFYYISQAGFDDSADLIADRQIAKWRGIILSSSGPNYIERVPYIGKVLRWDVKKFPLKVYIQSNSPAAPTYYQDQIKRAFMQWQASTSGLIRFQFVDNEKDADIFAYINTSEDMKKCTEDNCKYSVANTEPILSGDLLKKMEISFYDSNNLGKPFSEREIFATALHEIGHSLGIMGHSQNPDDLMYMSSAPPDGNVFTFVNLGMITSSDLNTLLLLYKLAPDITSTPREKYDTSRQFFPEIVLGNDEQVNSNKIIEAQNYIKEAPDSSNGYVELALAYNEMKQYSKAAEAFERAANLCSNDEEKFMVYFNFAAMYTNIKDWSNALMYARLAKSINSSADIDGLLGYIYYNSGDKVLAKSSYTEALQEDPTNIINSINLAVAYFREFNFVMAGRTLNNLVAANPDARNDPRVKAFGWLMLFFK